MKKKEIFSVGLYKEGLKRVKIPGIIFLVIMTLEAMLIPIFHVIEQYSLRQNLIEQGCSYLPYVPLTTVSASEAHPLLMISFVFIAPILTWTLFSFLNKRNASDFYHSLPHTRLALFTSNIAALITWVLGTILFTSGVSRLMLALFPNYLSVVLGTYIPYMIGCFAASMLVCAVVILAMSITGTVLNNIIVSGLILFLPRFIIYFISFAVENKFPLIASSYTSPLLSLDINIVTGIFDYLINYDTLSLHETLPQIYTLSLSIIYFVTGAVLFCRRKSESADRAAPSRFMQAVFRTVIATVICVFPCYAIFTGNITSGDDLFFCICMYIVAILAYLFYELITTRKWKNLLRATPGLAVVAVLNVAIIAMMNLVYTTEVNFTPTADEVDHISIVQERERIYDFCDYAEKATSDIKITDPDAIKAVTDALEENTERLVEHGNLYHYTYPSSYYSSIGIKESNYTRCTLRIKAGLTTKYRNIYLTSDQYATVTNALANDDEYAKIWRRLPEPQRGTIQISYGEIDCSRDEAEDFFEIMQNELSSADFEDWYNFLKNHVVSLGNISYTTNGNDLYVPISPDILPKTTAAYIELANKCSDVSMDEFNTFLTSDSEADKNGEQDSLEITSVSFYHVDENGKYCIDYISSMYNSEEFKKTLASCITTSEPSIEVEKDFFMINIISDISMVEDSYGDSYNYTNNTLIVPATENAFELLSDESLIDASEFYYD